MQMHYRGIRVGRRIRLGVAGLLALMLALAAPPLPARADTHILLNHVGPEGWPPYYFGEDDPRGIAPDILAAISAETGIPIETRYIPFRRGLKMLERGELHMETLIAPIWRPEPALAEQLIWSDPIFEGEEVMVHVKGATLPPGGITGQEVATVRGYVYWQEDLFTRTDVPNENALLFSVARGLMKVGLIERNVGLHTARAMGLDLEMGPVWYSYPYHIVLHKSRAQYMPAINAAIAKLRADGTIAAIIAEYTGPQALHPQTRGQ